MKYKFLTTILWPRWLLFMKNNNWKYIMRFQIIVGLLLLAFIQVSAASLAQSVTIHVKNTSLGQVFKMMEKQTGYVFLYDDVELKNKKVSISVKNTSVEKVLELCLDELPFSYKVVDKNVLFKKRAVPKVQKPIQIQSQQHTVTGQVQDSTGRALAGVQVTVEGTDRITVTDANGRYQVAASSGEFLLFSLMGHEQQRTAVDEKTQINMVMKVLLSDLDEVVVVGYGTQRRADLTGAIGTVDVSKSLKSRPVTNVQELLAGAVPGLNISKASGAVGSGATLNIRGTSTIGGSSGVLVLIDGVPGNINTLNPNDIESVSTLKDAASASIYGSRAANGVILVTTKGGQDLDKLTVEVNTSVGLQSPQFMIDFVGAKDFMELWDKALVNDGKEPLYGDKGNQKVEEGTYADIKWYEEIYKRNTLINNNYLAFSGSSEKTKYRFSTSHDYQGGTLPNNNYNRVIFKPDMTFKITDRLNARANIQYTETYIDAPQGGTDIWQTQATRVSPISFVKNNLGQYGSGSAIAGNPIAGVHESGYSKQKYRELMAIFELSYEPIEGMELKGNFSRYTYDNWSKNRVQTYELYDDKGEINSVENRVTSLKEEANNNYRNMLQFTADYQKSFGFHNFKLLMGFSQEYFKTSEISAFRDNLPFQDIDVLNSGSQTNMQAGGSASDVAIQSLFSRFNYDYEGRYLFQVNVRADGSSRFAHGHVGVFSLLSRRDGMFIKKNFFQTSGYLT